MKLIIVRHAIAEDRNPEAWTDDGQRPLTSRGRKRFGRAARGLARLMPDVDLVLASPHVRAWDTAQILHLRAGWHEPQVCDALRDGSPVDVLQALRPFEHMARVVPGL